MRKLFLKHAVVELVYKLYEKSTSSVCKGESIAKVPFKLFKVTYTHIAIYNGQNQSPNKNKDNLHLFRPVGRGGGGGAQGARATPFEIMIFINI